MIVDACKDEIIAVVFRMCRLLHVSREQILGMTACVLALADAAQSSGPEVEEAIVVRLQETLALSEEVKHHPVRTNEIWLILRMFLRDVARQSQFAK